MGCCVSSNKTSTSSVGKFHDPPKPSQSINSVEEAVKEVLSETPKLKPTTTFAKSKPQKPQQNTNFKKFKEEECKVEKKALSIYIAEDTSEVSSFSETVSIATSITDQREETRKRVDRSHAKLQKNRSFPSERRERTVHGARNNAGFVKLVQCREQTGQKMGNGGKRRRRDPADNTSRRARSPATGSGSGEVRPVMGRNPSVRKTNRSTARIRAGTAEIPENACRKMKIPATEGKRNSSGESLENPLVSLECFIFI